MLTGKRIVAGASGLLAAMALFGCTSQGEGSRGTANKNVVPVKADVDNSSSATPAPSVTSSPVGQPTGVKLTTLIGTSIPKMGQVVTDENGWVLYRFDKDSANPSASTCDGKCAQVWPPMLTDGTPELRGVAADKVSTVLRADGGMQVTLGGWPLYRYIGDAKPGQWKGQAVNGTWFVVAPDGKKNLTCLPSGTPTAVAPPAGSAPADNSNNGYGS